MPASSHLLIEPSSQRELHVKRQSRPLQHIVEPVALLLTWQPVDEHHPVRTRRVVARIDRQGADATFRYLQNTDDFRAAWAAGFKGHPAFKLGIQDERNVGKGVGNDEDSDRQVFKTGVLETFLRRLPPRKREDFPDFLAMHRLPSPFVHSDFALLGYTGAKLPSDGFSIVPIFSANSAPCDLVLEVAGFRHEPNADIAALCIGDEVRLVAQEDNPHDINAVAIFHVDEGNPDAGLLRIGYVNRAMTGILRLWMKDRQVSATIERVNGKPQRPLVYIRLCVR